MQKAILTFLLVGATCTTWAQQSLSNDAIIKMHASGLSDEIVVSTINSQPGIYSTSVDGSIASALLRRRAALR